MNDCRHTTMVLLYEGPGAGRLAPEERRALLQLLLGNGYSVTCALDEQAPSGLEPGILALGDFQADGGKEAFLNRQPGVEAEDIAGLPAARVLDLVEDRRARSGQPKPGAWKPWFPVIDFGRCTNCMQCLSFCLFGVYGVDEAKEIEVQNSSACKTNCPACSRVCPEAAIMFPKYKSGPINGELVSAGDVQREKMKIDVSALLGGDIYQMLRQRSERAQSRFSQERDADKALDERRKCLAKLMQAADVPPEVLMALPSPEEIQRKAQEAMAKAAAALKERQETGG